MSAFIETKDLSFTYRGEENTAPPPALENVNITIQKGEYVAILGHNGSGKSTLAKLLNLILIPSVGRVSISGITVDEEGLPEKEIYDLRRHVGMVFQNPDNQLVAAVVEEDVAFGPENLGLPQKEIRRRVDEALKTVGMTGYERRAPHLLSGGQKQRIAIAGVLAMSPDCIIFDESTAMLDPGGRREVVAAMEKLNREQGMTVLHITHYMEEAARADRIIVVNDGQILKDGTPAEVFAEADDLRAVGLDLPQGLQLLEALRREGYDVPNDGVSPEACTRALLALLRKEEP